MRSGTLPVPLIVGFGAACALVPRNEMTGGAAVCCNCANGCGPGIMDQLDDVFLNGHPTERLPGNLNLSFAHVEGEALLMACGTWRSAPARPVRRPSLEPSYVLRALGVNDELAHGSIRFGLGRFTTEAEVDYAIEEVVRVVNHLRAISPEHELARSRH